MLTSKMATNYIQGLFSNCIFALVVLGFMYFVLSSKRWKLPLETMMIKDFLEHRLS